MDDIKQIKTSNFSLRLLVINFTVIFLLNLPNINAQEKPNTITFDNKSGEYAVVKLIGPTLDSIVVMNGKSKTINVSAGEYYILVRYGKKPEKYNYLKGDPFSVVQTETEYSAIYITLVLVKEGNYSIHPILSDEFEKPSPK